MAREAYRSVYGDLTKLKDDSVLKDPAAGDDDDDELFELLLAVSDWIDRYCNRHFYPRRQTLLFDGSGGDRLLVPDLIALDELTEFGEGGAPAGQFPGGPAMQWSAADYRLLPYNAAPETPWGAPYGVIQARAAVHPQGFPGGEANFQAAGLWGYRSFAEDSGATLGSALDAAAAQATVSDGGQLRAGQTALLGGEQLLITAINGNALSLRRGLNGTAAAAHDGGAALRILRWPASVERAALIQTARIWTRAADFEPFYVDAEVDTDVRLLLEPLRRVN